MYMGVDVIFLILKSTADKFESIKHIHIHVVCLQTASQYFFIPISEN